MEGDSICEYNGLIKAIDNYLAKADDDFKDELKAMGRVEPEATVEHINAVEELVAAALVKETAYYIKQIKKRKTIKAILDDMVEIREKDIYCEAIKRALSAQFKEVIPFYASGYIKVVDGSLRVERLSRRATAWIESWSDELGEIMKLNSGNEIERILQRGLEAGSSVAEVTRAILDSGIRDEEYKARRVAVTEMLRAHNVAKQEATMQNPSVTKKIWRHTGEYKNQPRPNHVDMDGQVVPKNEPFELTGADGNLYYPMYPVDTALPPSEAINCHCIAQDVVDDDVLGLPLEERQRLQAEAIAEMDDEWEKELDAKNRERAGIE